MRKTKTISIIVLAICCLFPLCPSVAAQDEQPPAGIPVLIPRKFSARVDVVVDVPDEIKRQFTNCLLQELQSIGDVILTANNPQYRITVLALPNKTSKEDIGFTFSILITRPLDQNILIPLLSSQRLSEDEKKLLAVISKNYEKIEKTSLLTCSPNQIGRICEKIVSGFDADILDKDRRLWNSTWHIPSEAESTTPSEHKEDSSRPPQ